MVRWFTLLIGIVALGAPPDTIVGPRERLVRLPGATLLQGYPEGDVLYVTRGVEELEIRPPGPSRVVHHTYPSLSRAGGLIATSFIKTPYQAADDETGRTLIHRIAIERPKFVGVRGKGVTVLAWVE